MVSRGGRSHARFLAYQVREPDPDPLGTRVGFDGEAHQGQFVAFGIAGILDDSDGNRRSATGFRDQTPVEREVLRGSIVF
jgi:hypothetical protein